MIEKKSSFEDVKVFLETNEDANLDFLYQKFSLPRSVSSYAELVEALQDHPHSGYIALWILSELAKHSIMWVLNILELDLSLRDLRALPDNLSNLVQLESIDLRFNPIDQKANVLSDMSNLKIVNVSTDQSRILPDRDDWEVRYLHIYYCKIKRGSVQTLAVPHPTLLKAKALYLSGHRMAKEEALELTRPFVISYCVDNSGESEEVLEELFGNILALDDEELFVADLNVHYQEDQNEPIVGAVALLPVTSDKDASEYSSSEYYFGDKVINMGYDLISFELYSEEISVHLEDIKELDWIPVLEGEMFLGVNSSNNIEKTTILALLDFYGGKWP